MALKKRILGSLGANLVNQALNFFIQIASVPIFLKSWGIETYGEWLLLSTIPAYLLLSDLGFCNIASNEMTIYVAENKKEKAIEVLQTTCVFLVFIAAVMLAIVLVIDQLFLDRLSFFKTININEIRIIIYGFLTIVVIGLQYGLISAGYRCDGNNNIPIWINNAFRILEFIVLVILLKNDYGPVSVVISLVTIRLINYIFSTYILFIYSPWINFGIKYFKFARIKEMLIPSISYMSIPIGSIMKNQGLIMIVGIYLPTPLIVMFSTTRTLTNSCTQLMGIINYSLWPEYSIAYGKKNIALLSRLHTLSCSATFWISFCGVAFLSIFGVQIIKIWTLNQVNVDKFFFIIMLVIVLINSLWYSSSALLGATNNYQKISIINLFSVALSIVLSLIMIRSFALTGIGVALLVSEILMVYFVIRESLNLLNENAMNFFTDILQPLKLIGVKLS